MRNRADPLGATATWAWLDAWSRHIDHPATRHASARLDTAFVIRYRVKSQGSL